MCRVKTVFEYQYLILRSGGRAADPAANLAVFLESSEKILRRLRL